jgi:hypothetical protein
VLAICALRSLDVLGWMMPLRYDLAEATIAVVERVEPGDLVAFHPEFNRIVGHYYGLPANHPLHAALYKDPNVSRLETLEALPRPSRLWMVGSDSLAEGRGSRWMSEQRNEIEAFARWYGHAQLGEQVAASLRPGDTYIARFDPTAVTLEITHRRLTAAALSPTPRQP